MRHLLPSPPLLSLLLCALLLFPISIHCVAADAPMLDAIEYLGSGYDIFFGNPHATDGSFDPGFLDKENVFQLIPTQNLFLNQYTVPEGTTLRSDNECFLDMETSDVYGAQSYFSSLEVSVSADFSGFGASFSASSDYKNVQSGSSSSHLIYTSTKAICGFYDASIQPDAPPPITQAFSNAIANLPADQIDPTAYRYFVTNWGTHYVKGMTAGGRYGQISSLDQEKWLYAQAIGLDVNVAASYSGEFSVSTSVLTNTQQDLARNFSSLTTDQKLFFVGGKPPSDLSVNGWLESVQQYPMPIRYSIEPLYELLTQDRFPNDPAILSKAANLQTYTLSQYCQELLSEDQVSSCDPPPPDPPAPQLPKETCRFCDTNCGGDYPVLVGQAQHSGDWGPYSMFASGCVEPYTTSWDVMSVCCHAEPLPQCQMCLSCGGNWPNEMGRKLNQYDWPQWLAYDHACGGDSPQPTLDEVALCCQNTLTCRFCDACGDHLTEVGHIVHQGDWGPYNMFPQQSCTPGNTDNYGPIGGGAGVEPIFCCPSNISNPTMTPPKGLPIKPRN